MSRRRRELWFALGGLALGLAFVHRAVLSGQLHAGRDLFQIFIPETQYLLERWSALELPWWTSRVRLGQPFAATLYAQALYPPRVIPALLLGAAGGVTASIVLHGALAAAGAFWAARALGARPLAASLAGLFGLSPWFVRLSCSLHVVSALAWAPVAVAAAVRLSREPTPRRAAWLALAFAALLFAGCPEVALWLFPLCAVVAGRHALRWWALSAGLSVLLSLVLALPAAELWLQSERGGGPVADQLQWSASVPQLLSLGALNADFPLGPYFGPDQWFTTSLFVGAVPCALALLSLRRRRAWPLAAFGAVCGLLALGAHFAPAAAVLSVPPLAWFRYPVKYAFGLVLCVALLAPLGARELVVLARRRPATLRAWAAALVAALAALGLIPALVGLGPWRTGLSAGAFWAVGVAGLGAWLVWSPLLGTARARLGAVVAVAAAELVAASVLVPPVSLRPESVLQRPSALAAAIRAQAPGRVSIAYDEPELSGEAAEQFLTESRERLVPLRFLEEGLTAVEGYGFREPWRLTQVLSPPGSGAYRVFGVTHRVRQATGAPAGLRSRDGWAEATRVEGTFPPAWLVARATSAPEADALAALVRTPERLATEALVAPGAELDAAPCESPLPVVRRGEEWLEVQVDACAPRLLVTGEASFPGWQARIDGEEVEVLRADGMLRAVRVPAGPHLVRFTYRPRSVQVGAGGTLLGAAAVVALGLRRRKTS